VELLGLFSCSTTAQALKTQWAFSGTWNTPVRNCIGPGNSNTAATLDAASMNARATAVNTNVIYGASASSLPASFREWSANVVVTVAGNLSLQWAQNASSGNNITVVAGTTFRVRQIG
jgi:hypothetical protein